MVLDTITFLGVGIGVGVISSMFGIGGGSILIPFLTLVFGYEMHQAIASSLVIIVPTALFGAFKHAAGTRVPWRIAIFIALGGLAGANVGVDLSLALSEHVLKRIFVILLVVVAVQMYLSTVDKGKRRETKRKRQQIEGDEVAAAQVEGVAGVAESDRANEQKEVEDQLKEEINGINPKGEKPNSLVLYCLFVLAGVVTGIVSSLFGIGGGILLVPIMTLVFKVRVREAVAVSLAVIVPTSVMGAYRHAVEGNVFWIATMMIGIGGMVGAQLGVVLSQRLSEVKLRRYFAFFLSIMAVRMFF